MTSASKAKHVTEPRELVDLALANWARLNQVIMKLNRDQLIQLLQVELIGKRRAKILRRLHQRLVRLDAAASWKLVEEACKVDDFSTRRGLVTGLWKLFKQR